MRMKKTKQTRILIIVVILSIITAGICGCGAQNGLKGKWEIQSGAEYLAYSELSISLGDMRSYQDGEKYDWYFKDSKDVTILVSANGSNKILAGFSYEAADGKLRAYNDSGDLFSVVYSLDGDTLTATFPNGEVVLKKSG